MSEDTKKKNKGVIEGFTSAWKAVVKAKSTAAEDREKWLKGGK